MKVLDLGCGDGTTAFPGASSAPTCSASTSRSNLVAAGNRRAQEQGLTNCRFQEGDATDLQT
jgi:ubiquinone/menaquinone biosynthesis C-methylase UbiE